MIYKLSKKTFGTKQIVDLLKIETEEPIKDLCYVEDLGLVFSTGCTLGLITPSMDVLHPWKGNDEPNKTNGTHPTFGLLSGLCYRPQSKTLFVVEDGGRDVRSIDLEEDYTRSTIKKQAAVKMESLLKKLPKDEIAYVSSDSKDGFFLLIPSLSKCFRYRNSTIEHVAGDGKFRYSTGLNAVNSSIGMPSGMVQQGNKLYISDSLGNVIRSIEGDSISLFFGHPNKNILNSPSKIIIDGNVLYILCNDSIRTYMINMRSGGEKPIYESNIVSNIAIDSDRGLYILENQNA